MMNQSKHVLETLDRKRWDWNKRLYLLLRMTVDSMQHGLDVENIS
jgi:hypothetical protein